MLFALFALPVLVAGLPNIGARENDGLHLPFVRRALPRRGDVTGCTTGYVGQMGRSLDSIKSKYGVKTCGSNDTGIVGIDMINQGGDYDYLARIEVGTPPQSLDVQLDTGSADLWFTASTCDNCPAGSPEFNISQSSTLNDTSQSINLTYGAGGVSGILVQDTVTLGSYTIANQTFTAVTDFHPNPISGSTGGVLGLAFVDASFSKATPFWQALFNAGLINQPEMSFYFTRFKDSVSPLGNTSVLNPGGTLTLGGTNNSFYKGEIDFQPLALNTNGSRTVWLQTVKEFTLDGEALDIGNDTENVAAIDTGTQFIGGPTKAVEAFWSKVDGSEKANSTGLYQYPCTTNLTSTLSFGGKAWPIFADDMNLGPAPNTTGLCLGAVFDLQETLVNSDIPDLPNWLIGDTFLKNVYSVFRGGEDAAVGFAELADGLK
ncbi:unnamed protein product [Peniophora sp. CBMAI 1063]|nr:unnamed protein product [Peniophora sp. CBMAI 1063]